MRLKVAAVPFPTGSTLTQPSPIKGEGFFLDLSLDGRDRIALAIGVRVRVAH
jgi:hypothetical protein